MSTAATNKLTANDLKSPRRNSGVFSLNLNDDVTRHYLEFEHIMMDKEAKEFFQIYLRSRRNEEQLLFLDHVNQLGQAPTQEKQWLMIDSLIKLYIEEGSICELNISTKARHQLLDLYHQAKKETKNGFSDKNTDQQPIIEIKTLKLYMEELKKQVLIQLKETDFSRFVRTNAFQILLQMKQKQATQKKSFFSTFSFSPEPKHLGKHGSQDLTGVPVNSLLSAQSPPKQANNVLLTDNAQQQQQQQSSTTTTTTTTTPASKPVIPSLPTSPANNTTSSNTSSPAAHQSPKKRKSSASAFLSKLFGYGDKEKDVTEATLEVSSVPSSPKIKSLEAPAASNATIPNMDVKTPRRNSIAATIASAIRKSLGYDKKLDLATLTPLQSEYDLKFVWNVDMNKWTVQQVGIWLEAQGFGAYRHEFEKQGIHGAALGMLSTTYLKDNLKVSNDSHCDSLVSLILSRKKPREDMMI